MPVGVYKLADVPVQITSLYDEVQAMCDSYRCDEEPQLFISTSEADIISESLESDAERKKEGLPPYQFPAPYLETLAVYRQLATQLIAQNVLLVHGSVIAVDGEGYLFTALSGTGKSTHVRLWRKLFGSRAMMVNDDKPLIRIVRNSENKQTENVIVYGTPWDGKHHLSNNIDVPLKAIIHLQRGVENHIEPLTPFEMLPTLLQQTFRPSSPIESMKVLSLIDAMSKKLKFYSLHCNMEEDAAQVAYDGMN